MNGNISADAPLTSADTHDPDHIIVKSPPAVANGITETAALPNGDKAIHNDIPDNNDENDENDAAAESEAETLITSPVKKKEAAKQESEQPRVAAALRQSDAGDEADAPGSEDDEKPATRDVAKRSSIDDVEADEDSSDALSDVSDASRSQSSSRASSRSRAVSELPCALRDTLNPRKRKHRASSVLLPNKRQSVEGTRRRLRAGPSDEGHDRSESPKHKTHRRAISTQSFLEGATDAAGSRKRRTVPHLTSRESKQARWDESSVSSEATSQGQGDQRRRQRGIGRSTSGAGRPVGREHKRHVNKYGFTRLAEACESGELQLVKEWRQKDAEQLELAEFAGNKPLQIAALNGNAEVVEYLISQGCQVDCANVDKDTPLIDAAENGHVDVVRILLKAGVDPLRQNLKGQQALDVVADDTDNAAEIRAALRGAIETWNSIDAKQRREEEEVQRYRAGPAKELHFMARTYENLMRLVTINDRNSVREFLDARVPVDNAIIAAAAKTGDLYLMNMLLAEMTDKKRSQKAEKPMLSVIGTSHFDMVKSLTELDQFNPLWANRQGKKWSEIAEEKAGPMWRQEVELLQRLEADAEAKQIDRRSSSPILRRSDSSAKPKRPIAEVNNEDDSEEDLIGDDTPRRKNGARRLLSRKDMRAASRKTEKGSDDDALVDDNNDIDDDASVDESETERLKPPTIHVQKEKRGPGRPRTKGIIKREESTDGSRNSVSTHRRSSSIKQSAEKLLPTVQEAASDANVPAQSMDIDKDDAPFSAVHVAEPEEQTGANLHKQTEQTQQQQEKEVHQQQQQQQQQEEQHQQQQQQQEEERQQQQQQEEERQQQQEEAQQQQQLQEQLAAEAEHAEKEKQRQEEEARQQQLEMAALDAARSRTRQQLIDALPEPISGLLDPNSDFSYDECGALDTLLEYCEPLQVVYASDLGTAKQGSHISGPLVLNLAIAPLLGKGIGLQILLPEEAIEPSVHEMLLAQNLLPGLVVQYEERRHLDQLLAASHLVMPGGQQDEFMVDGDDDDSFVRELVRSATMQQSRIETGERLHTAPLVLRWLSLQHIVDKLHPVLHGRDITVREDWRSILARGLNNDTHKAPADTDFFVRVCKHWEESASRYTCRYAQSVSHATSRPQRNTTTVEVIVGK